MQQQHSNQHIFDLFTTPENTEHHVMSQQELTDMITTINQKHQQAQITSMHTFIMATHPRVGGSSAVYRIFRSTTSPCCLAIFLYS